MFGFLQNRGQIHNTDNNNSSPIQIPVLFPHSLSWYAHRCKWVIIYNQIRV